MTREGATPSPAGSAPKEALDRLRFQKVVWIALGTVLAGVAAAGIGSLVRGRAQTGPGAPAGLAAHIPPAGPDALGSLGEYGRIPEFSLTERSGATMTRAELGGRLWVADFIFTRCTGVCPLLSGRMASLQEALHGRVDVRLVSFSVDPDYDTPEILTAYARSHGADPSRWIFLTGPRSTMHRLIGEGFHLSVARAVEGMVPPGELITHSDRLVLVDRRGRIRGYYHGAEQEAVRAVLADIDRLDRGE